MVVIDGLERLYKLFQECRAQGIQLFRTVQGDGGDVVAALEENIFVGHDSSFIIS